MNNSFQLILDKNEREMNNQWTNIMIYSKYFLRIYNPIFTYFLRQFFLFVQTENVLNFTWDSFSAKPIKLTFHTIRHFDTKQEWLQKTNAILLVDTLSKAMLHIHNISSKTQNVTVLRFIKYTSLPWEIAQGNVMISEFLFLVESTVSSTAQMLDFIIDISLIIWFKDRVFYKIVLFQLFEKYTANNISNIFNY